MGAKKNRRKVIILGCTGSIGTTALQAMLPLEDDFEIVGLSAHSAFRDLIHIAGRWQCKTICLSKEDPSILEDGLIPSHTDFYTGRDGLLSMIRETDADIVLNGIAGSSGMEPTFAAIESHKNVALANKESIVMAGDILFSHAKAHGVSIIPVDSEHSTIEALIGAHGAENIEKLVITASGGPFRNFPIDKMDTITVQMAIAHPTWQMGAKISIDSATLANKGLEVIEASYLFGFSAEEIEVVVHPQSIVHSMVRLHNGAVYAQLSPPDMALPIMSAIAGPDIRLKDIVRPLDFTALTLEFMRPDFGRFPLLGLAFDVVQKRAGYPIAFNAANEVAVQAFIDGTIRFNQIPKVVEMTLRQNWSMSYTSIDEIISIDTSARTIATHVVKELV